MMERAQECFRASCWAGDGGVGEGGGREELGKRLVRRDERRMGAKVGGWRWVVMR